MRIVFFVNHFFPSVGGVQWSVFRTAEALVARGHDLTLITETPVDSGWQDESLPFRVLRFQVARQRPFTRLGYWRWMWRQRTFLRTADILHFHDYTTFFHWFLPLRFFIRSPRYAVTFHGFEHWPVHYRHRVFRSITARLCHIRFAVGEYVRKIYGHPVDAVFLGAPLRGFQQSPSGSDAVIAYAGRLSEDTGLLPMMKSLALAAKEVKRSVRVRLVGDGPLRAELATLQNEYLNIDFLGVSASPHIALAEARWVIATGYLGIFEAFTSGIPVLTPAYNWLKREYVRSIPDADNLLTLLKDRAATQQLFVSLLRGEMDAEVKQKSLVASLFVSELTWDDIASLHEIWYEMKTTIENMPRTQLEIAAARRQ